jgi:hypothetical protein
MTLIVGVHGIAQQNKGPLVLQSEWEPSLRDGASEAGGNIPAGALRCTSYGTLFRPSGSTRAAGIEHLRPRDVTPDEAKLLEAWLQAARKAEPDRIPAAGAARRASTPESVQACLRLLAQSRFFAGVAEQAMIGNLKQVRRYIREPEIRKAARAAVDKAVTADTRVIVAHSLGSVVAYEALHFYADTPRWANVSHFVTLGSPLGIPNVIFDQLEPQPEKKRGIWPKRIAKWTNISDDGDVVALVKKLGPLFGGVLVDSELVDIRIHNGAKAHDVKPYLTAAETGAAICHALA